MSDEKNFIIEKLNNFVTFLIKDCFKEELINPVYIEYLDEIKILLSDEIKSHMVLMYMENFIPKIVTHLKKMNDDKDISFAELSKDYYNSNESTFIFISIHQLISYYLFSVFNVSVPEYQSISNGVEMDMKVKQCFRSQETYVKFFRYIDLFFSLF